MSGVAMPLIAVSTLDAGAFEAGLLNATAWVPWLLIGLPAGVWTDRLRRRPIMLTAAAVSLVLFAFVPVAAWLGQLSIGLLLVVSLLTGTAALHGSASAASSPGSAQGD